jgi:hypothetical protein
VGNYDLFVAKLDTAGTYLWAAQAGGYDWDISGGLAVDANGNVHVTGYCIGNSAQFGAYSLFSPRPADIFDGMGYNLFVGTLSASGTWQRVVRAGGLDINNYLIGTSLAVDAQGNAYVAGGFRGLDARFGSFVLANEGEYNVFVACLGSNGTWRWVASSGGNGYDFANGVALDGRGGLYLAGTYSSSVFRLGGTSLPRQGFANDAFVAKLSTATGAGQWAVRASGPYDDYGSAIAVDGRGDAYLTGGLGGGPATVGRVSLAKPTPDLDLLVAKFNGLTGECQWAVRGGGPLKDSGNGIALDDDGTSYVVGSFAGEAAEFGPSRLSSAGLSDVVTASLDAAGNWRWALGSGSAEDDYGTAVAADGRQGAYVGGTFEGRTAAFGPTVLESGKPLSEFYASRGFVARASDHAQRSPANELTLWPNPVRRGATVWAAGLPTGQPEQVFDATGRLVVADARLVYQAQGLALSASLAAGLYVVRCGPQARQLVLTD